VNWQSAEGFLAMGGYGFYVWGAYLVTAAFMVAEPLLARRRHRLALRAAARVQSQEE
jgi:heme exporter protein D